MLEWIELTTESLSAITYRYSVARIDPSELMTLDALFHHDPSCQACYSAIINFLVNGGVRVSKPGFVCTPDIQQIFNTTWIVFAKMILKSVWCYGFVIVDVDENHRPFVIDPKIMDVAFISGPNGYKRIRLQESRYSVLGEHDKALSTPFVYVDDHNLFTGRVNSKVNCMRNLQSFQDLLVHCCIRAEQRRAVPPLVQEDPTVTPLEREELRDMSKVTYQGGLLGETEEEKKWDAAIADSGSDIEARRRAIEEKKSHETALQIYEQTREFARIENSHSLMNATSSSVSEEPYYGKRINVSQGKRLVAAQMAESPQMLMDLMKIVEADVAKIFSVPPGLWGSQRSDVERTQSMMVVFRSTIQTEKTRLCVVFHDMLNRIFGEINRQHLLDHLDPAKSLQQNVNDHEFQVAFPGMQDPEAINWLQETGSMNWETLNVYKAATFDIPVGDLAPKQLEISTGRPLGDIIEEERQLERQQMMAEQALQKVEGEANVKQTMANTAKTVKELPPWIATKVLNHKGEIKTPNALRQTGNGLPIDGFSGSKRKNTGFGNTQAEKSQKTRVRNAGRITTKATKRHGKKK
jgi:hypothetical protein